MKEKSKVIPEDYNVKSENCDCFFNDYFEEKCEEYHNFILNNLSGKLFIKRLMKLLIPTQGEDKLILYYYPKFNCFFYKDMKACLYIIAEYENELLDEQIYRTIESDSVAVCRIADTDINDNKVYFEARKFCINNNIIYHDDTDVLDYSVEKKFFNSNNKKDF